MSLEKKKYSQNHLIVFKRIVFLKRNYLYFLLLIFTCPTVFSQSNIVFKQFFINEGLSNNSINAIVQTRDGFLWIATKDGLNRYDGQNFKVFKNKYSDSTSIPENYVMSLAESSEGVLWVGTWGGGLVSYNPVDESFISFRKDRVKDDFIQCIFEDSKKNIWYGTTEGGLFCLDPGSGKTENYSKKKDESGSFPSNNITSIIEDNSHHFWIGTWDSGLIEFSPEGKVIQHLVHDPENPLSISDNGVWHILKEPDNTLLLSTFSGLDKYYIKSGKVIHNPGITENYTERFSGSIRQTFRDRKGRLWLGSYDYRGLFLINQDENGNIKNHNFIKEDDNPQSISIDRIRWIYEDMKGNLWVGTENGLNQIPSFQPFRQYRHTPIRPNSLGGRVVSSICKCSDNELLVGYGGGGFDRIDMSRNQVKSFKHNPSETNTLSNNDVTSIYKTRDGYIWISTMSAGLNRFNTKTEEFISFRHLPSDKNSIRSDWVLQVLETSKGEFLIGTNSGLDILERESGHFSAYQPVLSEKEESLPLELSVNALFEDSNKNIWIGTWLDGLYCYHPEEKRLFHYRHINDDPTSISSDKITCIFEDKHGLWFGTHSGGLNKFIDHEKGFIHYSTQNGLPNDVIFGILSDTKSNLWISTMNGLSKMNINSGEIRVYDEMDGLVNNQFNWRASFQDEKGIMYFGGINGFVQFHPDSVFVDTIPPLVTITSLTIFDKETDKQETVPASKEILLPHNKNFFSIEFTALDMAPSQKHQYAYILEGIDPKWVYSGTRNVAYYTNLHNGSFQFLIKAANADGVWSDPVSLPINILPAWWNTWWVKILGLLAIFGIGIAVARLRFWYLVEIERIRLNISRDLHDEMGSNLSSISVDSQQLMLNNTENETEYELASDIYKTARETMDSIRDIIWFINPKNDGGENLLFKMREKASTMLAGMKWTFEVSEGIKMDSLKLEIRRNLFLIYKETLTNIVKHSGANVCNISISKNQNVLQISISDNGKGFDLDEKKSFGGITNLYYRAKKIYAGIKINSSIGKGTSVILTLPLKIKKRDLKHRRKFSILSLQKSNKRIKYSE